MNTLLTARDEFFAGKNGSLFIQEKVRVLRAMQEARDQGDESKMVELLRIAGRKPWDDHGPGGPWGDPDGDDNGAYHPPAPGETEDRTPAKGPDSDLDIRAMCDRVIASPDITPEARMALVAIEARLAEMSLYFPAAIAGTRGKVKAALEAFRANI